jgi:hypothetical protein
VVQITYAPPAPNFFNLFRVFDLVSYNPASIAQADIFISSDETTAPRQWWKPRDNMIRAGF